MSIKILARDLYRLQKMVEHLEENLVSAPMEKRAEIEESLRRIRAEKASVRRALDGHIGR
jgi:hypothetical protein